MQRNGDDGDGCQNLGWGQTIQAHLGAGNGLTGWCEAGRTGKRRGDGRSSMGGWAARCTESCEALRRKGRLEFQWQQTTATRGNAALLRRSGS